MVFCFVCLPTSFLPQEDRGMFTTSIQLPSGSTQQQTLKVVEKVENYYFTHEKDNIMSVFDGRFRPPRGTGKTSRACLFALTGTRAIPPPAPRSLLLSGRQKRLTRLKKLASFASSPPAIWFGQPAGFDMELLRITPEIRRADGRTRSTH